MKKYGIFNTQLMRDITALGHLDSFVICDLGFPIPKDAEIVDLALVRGLPTVRQVIEAVLQEVAVQEVTFVEAAKESNPDFVDYIHKTFTKQAIGSVSFEEFREITKNAKFFIRTAEVVPCSNIRMVSASGVPDRMAKFLID